MALIGRERERAEIAAVVAAAAAGESAALVVHGDPGVGKTALLDDAAAHAEGMTVLRAAGVAAEAELGFAGLHALLRPVADRLDALPELQRDALAGALGLAPAHAADRFLVSAATLGLLAAAAEERPLLCLVDDAQWLDGVSRDALVFAARRLGAEGVAIVFAARDDALAASGLPALRLAPLDVRAAEQLVAPGATEAARRWLLAQAHGNPLALLELPRALTAAQLEGREALPAEAPLTASLEAAFGRRVDALDAGARAALLVAALDEEGDATGALEAAEAAGLVRIVDGAVAFRHPLVRSAVLARATDAERRRAHRELAATLSGDRRLWHEAMAASGPDERLAGALAASGGRSRTRGAHATAAAAFARAAALSEAEAPRGARLAAAADAAWAAGQPDRAREAVAQALPLASGRRRAELLRVSGQLEARDGDLRRAIALLTEAADAGADPSLALELLAEATQTSCVAGEFAGAVALGRRAARFTPADELGRFRAAALTGLAAALAGDVDGARPLLEEATVRADRLDDVPGLVLAAQVATLAGGHGRGLEHSARAVALARERGLLGLVPRALHEYAIALVGHGRFAAAYAAAEESLRLGTDIGQRWGAAWNLATLASLDAIRGDEPRAVAHADEAIELASLNGALLVLGFARRALGLLDLTVGRPSEATDRLLAAASDENAILALWAIPDLVEAAAGSDRAAEAAPHLDRYADWVARAPSAARLSLLARCEALAGRGDPRERFEAALAHGHAVSPFQQARTALHFGEWLRRRRARAEARPQLRRAAELFRQVGTPPWAARAEAELRATGEKPRRRDPSTLDDLTPQELQIAGLVAAGMTNREIAAQLYLSPRTIDYHLRKVFTKLGLTSRTDLVRLGVPA